MKPIGPCRGSRRISEEAPRRGQAGPVTDYCFQSGMNEWRYSGRDGDESPDYSNFHRLSRLFLAESAREYGREMILFSMMVLAAGWIVIYMVLAVVALLAKTAPVS